MATRRMLSTVAADQATLAAIVREAWAPDGWAAAPPQGAWRDADYHRLADRCHRLIEFTDGVVEVLPMPTFEHQAIVGLLYRLLHALLTPGGGAVAFAPFRLHIRPGKEREPDLLALRSRHDPRFGNRRWRGADLVIEVVSDDKPERDLVDKVWDYAEARIPEYWIVNPLNQTIAVLRLEGDRYGAPRHYVRGDRAQSFVFPEFAVEVDAVFVAG